MITFPVNIILENRPCLVIGGGTVAVRKVQSLLKARARVSVISPSLHRSLYELQSTGELTLHDRAFQAGDTHGFVLVVAASNDPTVNQQVSEEAHQAGILCNVVDQPSLCSFIMPSVIDLGALKLALCSGGRAPFATKRWRQTLQRLLLSEHWDDWWAQAGELRAQINATSLAHDERERLFNDFFLKTVHLSTKCTIQPLNQADFAALLEKLGEK